MEQIAIAAHACWFASKDPAFKPYRMANELNSFSGRPRFLLVPAKHPEGKPLLVVQAEGAAPDVQAFGPLMDEPLGERIGGRQPLALATSCGAAAVTAPDGRVRQRRLPCPPPYRLARRNRGRHERRAIVSASGRGAMRFGARVRPIS